MDISNPITESKNQRVQTAMVVYELEQALGKYVLDNEKDTENFPSITIESISDREANRGRNLDTNYVSNIVEATYLEEIFNLALHVAGESQEQELLSQLKQMCASLGIYTIRNAVSHPNRPFPECYWYRVAAIATDPLISKLRLHSVSSTFLAAKHGKIQSPPDEWVMQARWLIPNNLPESFDHSITGLIGRNKEIGEVTNALKNPRAPIIAVVAPGGRGKTALLLEVLEKISLDPESAEWIDEIFYLSFKTEILNYDGIQQIGDHPETTILGLQSAIVEELAYRHHDSAKMSFEDIVEEHQHKKLLLCLDNLETFLRESPDEFRNFHLSLPHNWRVIVTSRVTVEMAMTISLRTLNKKGAQGLARVYISRRGVPPPSNHSLEMMIERCQNNPLAIRLTIDSYLAGKSLQDAATLVHEEILKFSFTNLIETLSENSIAILECLFALGEATTRAELCTLLDLSRDQVAESFAELMGTSLVSRYSSPNEERTALSSSIRDLLLLNPIDTQLRSEIAKKVANRKALLTSQRVEQHRQDKTPLDWDYIPDDSPDHAKQLAIRVYGTLRKRKKVLAQNKLSEVQRAVEADPNDPLTRRVLGHLLITLGDHGQGKQYLFDAAVRLKPRDPAAAYDLAWRLLDSQDLEKACELAEWLIENGWDDIAKSDADHVRSIYRVYWLSLTWLGEVEKVIEGTKNWRDANELATVFGSIRVSALRRSVEKEILEIAEGPLLESIYIMGKLFELEGVTGVSANEGIKLVDDIAWKANHWNLLSPTLAFETCQFVDNYLLSMVRVHRDYTEDDTKISRWITTFAKCGCGEKNNPLHQEIWNRFLEEGVYVKDEEYQLIGVGYEIVSIYHRPDKPWFLFAKNDHEEEFYVNRDNFEGNEADWNGLKIGDRLAIIRGNVLNRDEAIPIREARII
jgi:NB-ARC domain